jgi:hypothetical protein
MFMACDSKRDRAGGLKDAGNERYALSRRACAGPFSEERVLEAYAMDVVLNAQGLGAWLDSSAARQSS